MLWNPYLHFDGRCKEAFEFYAQCLGGKIVAMMSYGEMPGHDVPAEQRSRIMHARLVAGDQVLMGGDSPPSIRHEGIRGCSIAVQVGTAAEAERLFAALAEGGAVRMPLAETFWAVRFGLVTDRFGVPWMINCDKTAGP
jgi:PhnB protein